MHHRYSASVFGMQFGAAVDHLPLGMKIIETRQMMMRKINKLAAPIARPSINYSVCLVSSKVSNGSDE